MTIFLLIENLLLGNINLALSNLATGGFCLFVAGALAGLAYLEWKDVN